MWKHQELTVVNIPEIVVWIIGFVVFLFGIVQYQYVQRIPYHFYLILSYCAVLLAWSFTILEGFFWESVLNILEHSLELLSVVLLAIWCFRIVWRERNAA